MNAIADWTHASQRALAAGVQRVRNRIEAQQAGQRPAEADPDAEGTALAALCRQFGLTAFERDVLLMCAGPEIDGGFPGVPTFGLALSALTEPHWGALLPQAPLRWWRLVTLAPDAGLVEARLRIEECILHSLAGLSCLDERVTAIARPLPVPVHLPPSQAEAAERLAACWRRGVSLVQLVGPAGEAEPIAAHAAASLGLSLFTAAPGAALAAGEEWLRLWQRDALIARAALILPCDDLDQPALLRSLGTALRGLRTPTLLAAAEPLDLPAPAPVRIAVGRPTADEQAALWRRAMALPAEPDPAAEAAIERAVGHFDLGTAAIAAAALAADGAPERLWAACRAQAATASEHAEQAAARASWSDLALPPAQEAMLREMLAQVRHRRTVQTAWGFGERLRRGLGVSALFHGPSGTGKSLAAEVLAAALDLDLHVIDLSRVVSKYIGETERHLRAVFEAAEASGAVLLFDEADALFGLRSEVRDSHDRYANIEVSYLLQRMEQYRGLAILTTNLKESIDPAFLRRIRFVVDFPHPGPAERARIWQRVLPEGAPREGLDHVRLAQVNLTGGHIRNVALAAAFLAAEAGEPIRTAHVLHAARRECAKLERPLTQAEIAGWL